MSNQDSLRGTVADNPLTEKRKGRLLPSLLQVMLRRVIQFPSSREIQDGNEEAKANETEAILDDILCCQKLGNCSLERRDLERVDEEKTYSLTDDPSTPDVANVATPRLFRRRWFMLLLFASYSATNAYQWLHLVIIGDKIIFYYNSSLPDSDIGRYFAVDFLSTIYMVVYIPLIFPATWMLDKRGLRLTAIVGCLLNAVGAWIKCFAVQPNLFALLFVSQTVCAVAQVFILGIPTRLAAVWFGIDEVSTATAIGVFGNQIGNALGFVIPPEVVISDDFELVGQRFRLMMYTGAGLMTLQFLLVLIFFQNNPPVPPSQAQVTAAAIWSNEDYCGSLRRLMTNVRFVLLVITYGINTGSFYAISTLLNSIIMHYFPGDAGNAGNVGLTMVIAGIFGSILAGIWLDKTKRFKMTTVAIYVLSFAGMMTFTFTLDLNQIWVVFFCSGILGFFMTGYLPVGFEFAAELTFPESEGTSSGLLNASAQVFGIVLTLGVRAMMSLPKGMLGGNLAISAALAVGAVATGFIKSDLRRQDAQQKQRFMSNQLQENGFQMQDEACKSPANDILEDALEFTERWQNHENLDREDKVFICKDANDNTSANDNRPTENTRNLSSTQM